MAKVEFAFVAGCLTLLTACGDPIPPGALISPLPTKTSVPVAPVVPTADDPYKVERLDTPESVLAKLRQISPNFREDEPKQKAPPVPQRGVLKDYMLPGILMPDGAGGFVNMDQPVWTVELRVAPWTEVRGPEGGRITSTYNSNVYVIAVETGKVFNVQKKLVKE